ncbi:hypothetical protein CSV70_14355 [Sporosarcina sp. P25]|nr:hypothetical protein CSV70_14355 [Sporosarcina sp. P25]
MSFRADAFGRNRNKTKKTHEGSFFSFMHFFDYVFIKVTFVIQKCTGAEKGRLLRDLARMLRPYKSASAGERTIF